MKTLMLSDEPAWCQGSKAKGACSEENEGRGLGRHGTGYGLRCQSLMRLSKTS